MGRLLALRALRSLVQAALAVAVPLYLVAVGFSTVQVGWLLVATGAGSLLMVVAVGLLSDRWGRARLLSILALVSAAAAATFARSTSYWPLLLAAGVAAIGRGGGAGSGGAWGPFYPAEQALVADSVAADRRNAAFGALSFAGVLASAAGSILAAWPQWLHLRGMPWVGAYQTLFAFGVPAGLALAWVAGGIREAPGAAARPAVMDVRLRALLSRLGLTNSLNGLWCGLMGPFLTYWFHQRYGVGPAAIGTFYALVNLLSAFPFLGAATLARRLGAVRTVVTTRLASVATLLALAAAPTFLVAACLYALRSVFGSLGSSVRQSYVMGVAPEQRRGTVAALGNLPSQVTEAVSPGLGSVLLDAFGFAAPLLLAASALFANAAAFHFAFRRWTPPEERSADTLGSSS